MEYYNVIKFTQKAFSDYFSILVILVFKTKEIIYLIFYMIKPIIFTLLLCLTLSQYNPDLSKSLCELTVASYCRPTKILDWSCAPCQNSGLQIQNISLFVNSTKATLGYIAVSKKLNAISNILSNI